jgi:hypothetical protein
MLEATASGGWQRRLMLGLLLAPALLWLFALIVLPHLDLALLSLRERVAPRVYEFQPGAVPHLLRPSRCTGMFRAHGDPVGDGHRADAAGRVPVAWTSPSSRAGARSRCCSSCA